VALHTRQVEFVGLVLAEAGALGHHQVQARADPDVPAPRTVGREGVPRHRRPGRALHAEAPAAHGESALIGPAAALE